MRTAQKLVINYLRTKFRIVSSLSKRKAAEKAFDLFCTPQYRNRKQLPKVFEEAEKLSFKFQQYNIRGYRWNVSSDKRVLILHGFESSVINFDRYIKPLIAKGFSVLAFDAPAHGRSSGKKITVITYKEFIKNIIQQFGPIRNFISHSFGGLALCLAIEELEHDDLYRLVLIAPAAETTTAIDSFFKLLKLDQSIRPYFNNIIVEKSGKYPDWYSISRAVENIKAQILICQDKDDKMTPLSDLQHLVAANKNYIQFYITEGLGHRRIYRDNKVFKGVIDFLQ